MTIATQRSTLYRTLLLLGVASLVACGGGGGSTSNNTGSSAAISVANSIANSVGVSSSSIEATGSSASTVSNVSSSLASSIVATSSSSVAVADTTPAVFNFAPTTDAALSTAITSPAITLSGFDVAVPISITNGEYSINGGAFTSAAGTISPAQTLAVKVTSSNANSTAVTTTLTVGGVSATYTVTTLADAIPDAFSFTPATNVEPDSTSTSNAITVNGIEVATAISITGGEYSINSGAFTSAAGTVTNGQTIAVKAVAPAGTELTQNAVVTIGGVSGTYSVTTVPDTTPPVAEFKFPTPYTMSEAMSVKVRGTATDDNTITSVKVVMRSFDLATPDVTISSTEIDVTPKAEGDYSSWTVDVPLMALAENEIKVVAMDEKNNAIAIEDANKVVIRQAPIASAFPDEVNEFAGSEYSAFDVQRNRIMVSERGNVSVVDLTTGKRTVFADHESICSNRLVGLTVDAQGSRLYGICSGKEIVEFNLLDGAYADQYPIPSNPNQDSFLGLALDRLNGRNRLVLTELVYEYGEEGGRVMGFSLDSKEFSVISDASELPLIKGSFGGVIDGDSYWVTAGGQHEDAALHKVIKVNVITGKREVFADNATGSGELFSSQQPDGNIAVLTGIVKDTKHNRLIVVEDLANRLLAIDLGTGERSLFKDLSYKGTPNFRVASADLNLDEINGFVLMPESRRKAIIMVDLETREKVILSKSKNNF